MMIPRVTKTGFTFLSSLTLATRKNVENLFINSKVYNPIVGNKLPRNHFVKGIATTATLLSMRAASSPHSSDHSNHNKGVAFCDPETNRNVATTTTSSSSMDTKNSLTGKLLTSQSAFDLDQDLMSQPGFSLEQLMELAGLSVAEAAYRMFVLENNNNNTTTTQTKGKDEPQTTTTKTNVTKRRRKLLILCGPGNNGGDGLVAARHLTHFGCDCVVVYPKRSRGSHFVNLVVQCENAGVRVLDAIPFTDANTNTDTNTNTDPLEHFDGIIDALFGFSFRGPPREPLASVLRQMIRLQRSAGIPILSVDVPSGWHVEDGAVAADGDADAADYVFAPEALISLTAPKRCVRYFHGRHFIGGRFLPDSLAETYGIRMPPYEGTAQVYEVPNTAAQSDSPATPKEEEEADWSRQYQTYLEEKALKEQTAEKAFASPNQGPASTTTTGTTGDDDWAVQYQKYLEEKHREETKTEAKNSEKD